MNREDVAKLLAIAAEVDHRKWDQITVNVWLGFVGDLPFSDAAEALRRHYSGPHDYLEPHHIRVGVAAIRTERFDADPDRAIGWASTLVDVDEGRGVKIINFVMAGLTRARAAAGGRLGRTRSATLGNELVVQALDRWPATTPTAPHSTPCGRPGCRCTHDVDPGTSERCEGGWVEIKNAPVPVMFREPVTHRDTSQADMVRKCPICDPDGAARIAAAVTRHGGASQRDIIHTRWAAQKSLRTRKRGHP